MKWFEEKAIEHIDEEEVKERYSDDNLFIFNESVKSINDVKTPDDLMSWMKRSILYSHGSHFKSYKEVLDTLKGDCHDQTEFESHYFRKMNIKYGKLFIIEYRDWNHPGGSTHSLLYFYKNNKIYWFENAWEDEYGIHGPYKEIDELKKDICKRWKFSGNFDKLLVTSVKGVKPGMTLNDYVNSCLSNVSENTKPYYQKESSMNETTYRLPSELVDIFYDELKNELDNDDENLILEAVVNSTMLRDTIYPFVENTFKGNPANVRKFNQLVSNFINRNIEKLTTSGPVYLIPFTDRDKSDYYTLFGINEKEIKKVIKDHTKSLNSASNFLLLTQNPIFVLFYFVIRYFTLHQDNKSLNSALSIYALSAYPSIFSKYFPKGVIEPVMRYTIDNLTDKFLIKKSKHVFGVLVESMQRSYKFLKPYMKDASDKEVIRFIQRIRNDHNSLFKKISNMYMQNHKNGYAISTTNTTYDDNTPIVDEINNATTEVQNAVLKVSMPIIANGVDIIRAEASAKMSGIGVSDCRFFLTNIMIDKNIDQLQRMIESILFLYIYEDKKTIRDIRSQYFLAWAASLFKKTNSKNDNILRINQILNHWAEESGIYAKFRREASRINYKKALFFYVILSIQKYI